MADTLARNRRHRDLLRPEPGAVRSVAVDQVGRDDRADGPQRHGQDHHHPLHHGPDPGAMQARSALPATTCGNCRPTRLRSSASASCPRAGRFSRTSPCAKTWSRRPAIAAARKIRGRWRRSTRCFRASPNAARNMGVTLSGGEQQMLAIGRALMTNPRLLDPRRSHRRPRAADPRRDLELPVDAEGARPVGAGRSTRTSATSPKSPTATT